MKLNIKTLVLATALALPAFFAGNAFASSCGTCVTGKGPTGTGVSMDHTAINAAMMACTTCHTAPVVTPPVVTPPVTNNPPPVVTPPATTGTVKVKSTSKSCGSCTIGTAPSGVSAHANVNSTNTPCAVCHTGSSAGGGTTTPPTTGTVTVRRTTEGCGSCTVGTAPGSVSAHKNVNSTNTPCSVCHGSSGGNTGGMVTPPRGSHADSDDDHAPATGTTTPRTPRGEGRKSRRGHDD